MSSSATLRQRWVKEGEILDTRGVLFKPENSSQKVLGLLWDPLQDQLTYQMKSLTSIISEGKNTKRSVLKGVARIFDPLGLISPVIIVVKCLFQEIWEQNLNWDDELPLGLARRWNGWCQDLIALQDLAVSRRYDQGTGEVVERQLHVFCDASTKAYGCVIYLRTVRRDSTSVCLVVSKNRVAPLKRLTLPRLELMSNLLGARLVTYVKRSSIFQECSVRVWTDSTVALRWIQSQSQLWKLFVANRVADIHSLVDLKCWGHCPGHENPADLLTRGESIKKLKGNTLWWHGPEWLMEEETC